jgi:hypothetical protein
VPDAGNPVNVTLPVETEHVGWIIVPITGAGGAAGGDMMTISAEGAEVHPVAFVTV